MTYIAQHTVTYTGEDGASRTALPGQAIPEFAGWAYVVRRALLNLGRVIDTEANGGRHLSTAGGQLHFVDQPPPKAPGLPVATDSTPALTEAMAMHACPHCSQSFGTARGLKKHRSQAHKGA